MLIVNQSILVLRRSSDIKQENMKTTVALCLLAVLCTVDAFRGLEILKAQLQKSKSTVDSRIFNLERLYRNTKPDTKTKATNKYIEHMSNYNNYLNPTIADIRKDVEAAKAEGKNAQSCYDNALANLEQASNMARKDGDQCIKTAESSINSELNFIHNLVSTGKKLKGDLDAIFPSCFGNDIIQMQSCIAIKLGTTNVLVRNFESDANSADNTAKFASNNVVLQADKCIRDVISVARSRITEERLAATKCLKAL